MSDDWIILNEDNIQEEVYSLKIGDIIFFYPNSPDSDLHIKSKYTLSFREILFAQTPLLVIKLSSVNDNILTCRTVDGDPKDFTIRNLSLLAMLKSTVVLTLQLECAKDYSKFTVQQQTPVALPKYMGGEADIIKEDLIISS